MIKLRNPLTGRIAEYPEYYLKLRPDLECVEEPADCPGECADCDLPPAPEPEPTPEPLEKDEDD